ncbi:hypothetical protein [Paenibacillus sp. LjRoot56]
MLDADVIEMGSGAAVEPSPPRSSDHADLDVGLYKKIYISYETI